MPNTIISTPRKRKNRQKKNDISRSKKNQKTQVKGLIIYHGKENNGNAQNATKKPTYKTKQGSYDMHYEHMGKRQNIKYTTKQK